tara:strand:- start:81 stop:446 length:366 start_codon:yes stop_codon:yes gene_type:complete
MSIFLEFPKERILYKGEFFFIAFDKYPVTNGHCLIISNEVKKTYFDLSKEEKQSLPEMIEKAKELIEHKYKPDGYNIGINSGKEAGQTVMHFHCHVIPRYKGDMKNPEGGVRGVIPERQKY